MSVGPGHAEEDGRVRRDGGGGAVHDESRVLDGLLERGDGDALRHVQHGRALRLELDRDEQHARAVLQHARHRLHARMARHAVDRQHRLRDRPPLLLLLHAEPRPHRLGLRLPALQQEREHGPARRGRRNVRRDNVC